MGESVGQAAGLCGPSVPWEGFQGLSDNSLGRTVKTPKRFSEGKLKTEAEGFPEENLEGAFKPPVGVSESPRNLP